MTSYLFMSIGEVLVKELILPKKAMLQVTSFSRPTHSIAFHVWPEAALQKPHRVGTSIPRQPWLSQT